jgi:hypothetical protein
VKSLISVTDPSHWTYTHTCGWTFASWLGNLLSSGEGGFSVTDIRDRSLDIYSLVLSITVRLLMSYRVGLLYRSDSLNIYSRAFAIIKSEIINIRNRSLNIYYSLIWERICMSRIINVIGLGEPRGVILGLRLAASMPKREIINIRDRLLKIYSRSRMWFGYG